MLFYYTYERVYTNELVIKFEKFQAIIVQETISNLEFKEKFFFNS